MLSVARNSSNSFNFLTKIFCISLGLHYLCTSSFQYNADAATTICAMTKIKYACACLIAAAMLAGCNDDVFIDNFMPDVPQVLLSEDDSCEAVRFNAANWGVLRCYSLYGGMETSATTLDGEPQKLPWSVGGEGRLSYGDSFLNFGLEKSGDNELRLSLRENLYSEPVRMYIEVGNEYETRMLEPLLMPTPKYRVDSVAYDWDGLSITSNGEQLKLAYSIDVDNSGGTQPAVVTVYPYRDAKRRTTFYASTGGWIEMNYRRVFGDSLPSIGIPDIVDGKATMQGAEVVFGKARQHTGCGMDATLAVQVSVEPGDRRTVEIYNEMYAYSVPYTVYASCPWSGRRKVFTGTLTSSRPEGYLIFKRKAEEGGDE